jgi:hypothetical protein
MCLVAPPNIVHIIVVEKQVVFFGRADRLSSTEGNIQFLDKELHLLPRSGRRRVEGIFS